MKVSWFALGFLSRRLLARGAIVSEIRNDDSGVLCTSKDHCDEQMKPESLERKMQVGDDGAYPVITFSEFSLGTFITNQYQDRGVIFGGDSPFISVDGSNPTAPVLSGSPRFSGAIEGRFVVPESGEAAVVESFSFDAGFFNAFGSTRVLSYSPEGEVIEQQINPSLGIPRFQSEGGNIARFRIEIFGIEANGYAIDNFVSTPLTTSLLFRESALLERVGRWPWQYRLNVPIPGFDHVALNVDDVVYESHPGYSSGVYRDSDTSTPTKMIQQEDGVQMQFTRALFRHNSQLATTGVVEFVEVPIPRVLAEAMLSAINTKLASLYLDPDFTDFLGSWSNDNQKGANDKFTCVGLIEWAAEQAGFDGGQGFVPNQFESIDLSDDEGSTVLLSPQLMHYFVTGKQATRFAKIHLQGFVDPVDFLLTDPLGRVMGYTAGGGRQMGIPNAFLSPNGVFEQLVIPNAVSGTWTLQLIGLGDMVRLALDSPESPMAGGMMRFEGFLEVGEEVEMRFEIPPVPGGPGDVDGDGIVNANDLAALQANMDMFTEGLSNPGDLNGDGRLNEDDIILLAVLLDATPSPSTAPVTPPPSIAPVVEPSVPPEPPVGGGKGGGKAKSKKMAKMSKGMNTSKSKRRD